MATVAENLLTAKANIAAEMALISAILGPTYSKDGQSFDKIGYLKGLREELQSIDDALAQESPYEIRSVMGNQIWPWGYAGS